MARQLSKQELRQAKPTQEEFSRLPRNPIYVLLDGLKTPQNIGMILRVCEALLVKKVYLCGDMLLPPDAKIRRTSRCAENWVEWEYVQDAATALRDLKRQGVCILAAEIADHSIAYTQFTPTFPVCLVLGREDEGVSQAAPDLADAVVHLPIWGMCNSLNVAGTAHVLLYDLFRHLNDRV